MKVHAALSRAHSNGGVFALTFDDVFDGFPNLRFGRPEQDRRLVRVPICSSGKKPTSVGEDGWSKGWGVETRYGSLFEGVAPFKKTLVEWDMEEGYFIFLLPEYEEKTLFSEAYNMVNRLNEIQSELLTVHNAWVGIEDDGQISLYLAEPQRIL